MTIDKVHVQIQRLPAMNGLPLPRYMTDHAAAMDVVAAVTKELTIHSREVALVRTGFKLAVPNGYEGQLRPRSGLATKYGITIPNSPATIDADYRGEILVPLLNLGDSAFKVRRGRRIAQLLVLPVPRVLWKEVSDLSPTDRGARGFGHTGD